MAASMLQKDTVTANDPTQGARGAKNSPSRLTVSRTVYLNSMEKATPAPVFLRTDRNRDVPGIVQEQLRGRNDEPPDEDAGGEE